MAAVRDALGADGCPSPTSLLRLATNDYHSVKKGEGHLDTARLLLQHGAVVDREMFYQVARNGFAEMADLLLQHIDERDVFIASALGDVDSVMSFQGAAPATDEAGRTALHFAGASSLWRTDPEVAESTDALVAYLLQHNAVADAPAHCGGLDDITPLEHVCWTGGHRGAFDRLLQAGAQPTTRALWAAVGHFQRHGAGHYELAEALLSLGLDVNKNDGRTLLHAFSSHEDARGVGWLLEHGADVTAVDDQGNTPLHLAARRNTGRKVIELLLQVGAASGARNADGLTPAELARQKKRGSLADVIEALAG